LPGRFINIFLLAILCYLIFILLFDRNQGISISEVTQISINEDELFINTTGCRISSTAALSEFAKNFMDPIEPIVCQMAQLMIAETVGGRNYLKRNISESGLFSCCRVRRWKDVSCIYREFLRVDEKPGDTGHKDAKHFQQSSFGASDGMSSFKCAKCSILPTNNIRICVKSNSIVYRPKDQNLFSRIIC